MVDLGEQPLANAFLSPDSVSAAEPRYPLELCRCPACGHAQLSVTVAPEILFRDYPYVSGTSETIPAHFRDYAAEVERRFLPPRGGFVVELGSNDGTLLQAFDRTRVRVLGVDPAANIAAIAARGGVPTRVDFFGERVAGEIRAGDGPADAIIANNVVAHIDDLRGLARGIAGLLAPDGVFVAEFPYLVDLLDRLEYDTIYHEHLSYFTVSAVAALFRPVGLSVFDARRVAVHGGSLRVYVGRRAPAVAVAELLALERDRGLGTAVPFQDFARRVTRHREALGAFVRRLRDGGARLAGYGAAAKGTTLLNACAIDANILDFIVDRNPLKHGRLAPGTRIPVRPVEALLSDRPDYVLLLAWNFAEEILRQQAAFRAAGGRFLIPIPDPAVLP